MMKRVDRITNITKEKVPVDLGDLNYLLLMERFSKAYDVNFEIFRTVLRECLIPKTGKKSL